MPQAFMLLLFVLLTLPAQALSPSRILLTNDDGFRAPGISALYKALVEAGHEVILVAPATQQSGASASMQSRGVKLQSHEPGIYSVTGRPSDAARIGLLVVMKDSPPDLVISGINFGQNAGQEVIVSGTVGAAVTAMHLGFPAIAVSTELLFKEADQGFPSTLAALPGAARFIKELLATLPDLSSDRVLNVNYPATPVKGVTATEIAEHSLFDRSYRTAEDGSLAINLNPKAPLRRGTDAYELHQGYITFSWLDGSYASPVNRPLKRLAKKLDRIFEE